jgi:hypothetical protein
MRFAYGTVAAVSEPADTTLSDLDAHSSILFRVKIVDALHNPCLILASANQLRPLDKNEPYDDRRPLLPVRETAELGEALWRIDIQTEAGPELQINNGIPSFLQRLRSEPLIQGMILPHAFERILEFICLDDQRCDDEVEWVQQWTTFIEDIGERAIPDDDQGEDERRQFISDCVSKFCDRNQFRTLTQRVLSEVEDV